MEQSVEKQLELIRRNAVEIIPEDELRKKIERAISTGTPLRVKIGLDPNRPDLHIGHSVALQKLRDFQDLGHKAVLIVGDFTGFIGDPSGRDSERAEIDWDTVRANAQTYFEQASKIIDYESAEVRYNSEWLLEMNFKDVLALARSFTVHRMLERDDFDKRYHEGTPISIMEFLYPLAQAYDSVAIKADIELGGTDQRFNLMVGRIIQERYGQEPQCLVINPLLEGTDGVRKMSKSLDNYVAFEDEPHDMFGKIMRIPDELIGKWRELVTLWPHEKRVGLEEGIKNGFIHPMEAKRQLACDIVKKFHDEQCSQAALEHFTTVFSKRELPSDEMIPEFEVMDDIVSSISNTVFVVEALYAAKLVASKSEGKRFIRAGGVYWKADGTEECRIESITQELNRPVNGILRIGKRKIIKLIDKAKLWHGINPDPRTGS